MRISDVCLLISDIDTMSVFYGDAAALRPRMRNENFADFEFPTGPRQAMWETSHVAESIGSEHVGQPGNRFTRTFAARSREAVDEVSRRLERRLVAGPAPWGDGQRRATFRDPEGFVFHVVSDASRSDGEILGALADVELLVADVDRATAFYAALGLRETARGDGFAAFDGGGSTLTVASEVRAGVGLPAGTFTDAGSRLMGAIELDTREAVDALHASLLDAGVDFSGPPTQWPWGAWASYFSDPDGVLWEIYAWVEEPYTW
jgi:catechol 2,3-dioxygenase-like lactoylglutathione lyase family enzyme